MVYPGVRVKAETCTFGNKCSSLHLPWGGCIGWEAANNKPTVDIYLGGHGMKKQGCPAPFLLDIFFQFCFSYRVFLLRLTLKTPLTHDLAPRTTPINLSTHPFLCLPNTTAHPAIRFHPSLPSHPPPQWLIVLEEAEAVIEAAAEAEAAVPTPLAEVQLAAVPSLLPAAAVEAMAVATATVEVMAAATVTVVAFEAAVGAPHFEAALLEAAASGAEGHLHRSTRRMPASSSAPVALHAD